MSVRLTLSLVVGLISQNSCKPRTAPQSAVKRYQYDDAKCSSADNPTNCRLLALTAYGENLLSATAEIDDVQRIATNRIYDEYNIPRSERSRITIAGVTLLKDTYTIGPTMGSLCFDNDAETNIYWTNWFSGNQLTGPRKQMEALAEFVAEHHALRGGVNDGPFTLRQIEFCPVSVLKARMTLSGTKLKIGLPKNGSEHGHYTSQQIKDMWDSGEFFLENRGSTVEETSSIKKTAKDIVSASKEVFLGKDTTGETLWMALNPAGEFRVRLRKGVSHSVIDKIKSLRQTTKRIFGHLLSGKSGNEKLPADKVNEFIETALGVKVASNGSNLQVPLSAKESPEGLVYNKVLSKENLHSLSQIIAQGKVKQFIDEWDCQMQEPQLSNQVSDMAQSIVCNANNESTAVRYRLTGGGISVANFHDIDVCANFSFGGNEAYTATLTPEEVRESKTFSFDVESDAKINVVTGDKISVKALMKVGTSSVSKSLESVSFVNALRAVMGSEKSCVPSDRLDTRVL